MHQETRAYFFNNMYLQGIHAGIQSAHTIAEMMVAFPDHPLLKQWATIDKTIIVLNAGYSSVLEEFITLLMGSDWPFAYFNESQEALNGALTNVGVILPESIYNFNSEIRKIQETTIHSSFYEAMNFLTSTKYRGVVYTPRDLKLIEMMSKLQLMR